MIDDSGHNNRVRFLLLFLNFLLFGAILTSVGAILPLIIRAFEWSYLATGGVIAVSAVGYFTSTFFAGIWVHRLGGKRMILSGLLLQTIGLGLFGAVKSIPFNCGAFMLLGMGQGTTEVVTNYCVVQMERTGQSRLMNLMHSGFTVGAIVAPFCIGIFLEMGIQWRYIYLLMATLSFLMMLALMGEPFQFSTPEEEETRDDLSLSKLIRHPLLTLLTLTIFLYVGAEIGISSWISEYFVKVFRSSASTGAMMVSIFWLGIFLGRLLTSLFYKGSRQAHLLLGFSCASGLSLAAALLVKAPVIAGGLFFFTGIGYSTIYPLVMALAGKSFKKGEGLALGIVSTGGGIGAFLFPLVMSSIANHYSITQGFWFYMLITLALVGTTGGILWSGRSELSLNR